MNKVEIRGIIVSSMYDDRYLFDYIQRGIITPESYFRKQLAKADKNTTLDLYINSQGGSVFAGNEMINALLAWKQETGQKINVTVGGLAASMAANTIVQVADTVKVYANTLVMFHGASGYYEGGAEGARDYSELLDKINDTVKMILISKYGFNSDDVASWFAEGRAKWFNATELKQTGIANEIINETKSRPETTENIDNYLTENGEKIAAKLTIPTNLNNKKEGLKMKELIEKIKQMFKKSGFEDDDIKSAFEGIGAEEEEAETTEEETEETTENTETETTTEESGEETEENALSEVETLKAEFSAKIKDLEKQISSKQSENDKLKNDIKKLTASVNSMLGNGFESEGAIGDNVVTWAKALELCKNDYVKARKEYPNAYKAFMDKVQ